MTARSGNLVWTNHALERLAERQFSRTKALEAFIHPNEIKAGKQPGTEEYRKRMGNQTVTLIVATNDRGEKVVISCWINPPVYGTRDYYQKQKYREYQNASPLKKIWLIIKEQLGF